MRDFSELRRYVSHLPGTMRSNYEALMESGLLWQVEMQKESVGEKRRKNEVVEIPVEKNYFRPVHFR